LPNVLLEGASPLDAPFFYLQHGAVHPHIASRLTAFVATASPL
jgi:hypothetical protein